MDHIPKLVHYHLSSCLLSWPHSHLGNPRGNHQHYHPLRPAVCHLTNHSLSLVLLQLVSQFHGRLRNHLTSPQARPRQDHPLNAAVTYRTSHPVSCQANPQHSNPPGSAAGHLTNNLTNSVHSHLADDAVPSGGALASADAPVHRDCNVDGALTQSDTQVGQCVNDEGALVPSDDALTSSDIQVHNMAIIVVPLLRLMRNCCPHTMMLMCLLMMK